MAGGGSDAGAAPAAPCSTGTTVSFDVAGGFHGCVPGINDVLRRQGLLAGRWTLDPHEDLSPGQAAEIDRVCAAYPWLTDDDFVAAGLDSWLR